ncbi:MAG: hypothetical protein AAGA54_22855 [Myxococcota bacterium]
MGDRLAAYLDSLPNGVDSYPDIRAKASLIRLAVEVANVAQPPADVPEPIRRYFTEPPLPSTWLPEVHYNAFSLAVADARGFTVEQFGAYWYTVSKRLVQSPLYAGLLGYLTPSIMLRTAALRWSAFHRGIKLKTAKKAGSLHLELTYPAGLVPELCIEGYRQVFSAVTHVGKGDATVRLVERSDDYVIYGAEFGDG